MRKTTTFRRRNLPHWDIPGATYFVTACLEGSIPSLGLLDIDRQRKRLFGEPIPNGISPEEWEFQRDELLFSYADEWLDQRPAVRHLADPILAAEVRSAIAHFEEERYEVYAYVIMASHIHWIFRPRPEWIDSQPDGGDRTPREIILHSLKRHCAYACNLLLNRTGMFWQAESYDRVVRDEDELIRFIVYIENNPVKAGLVKTPQDWLFSSARERPLSQPLSLPIRMKPK